MRQKLDEALTTAQTSSRATAVHADRAQPDRVDAAVPGRLPRRAAEPRPVQAAVLGLGGSRRPRVVLPCRASRPREVEQVEDP